MQQIFDLTPELTFSVEEEKYSYIRVSEFGKNIQVNSK